MKDINKKTKIKLLLSFLENVPFDGWSWRGADYHVKSRVDKRWSLAWSSSRVWLLLDGWVRSRTALSGDLARLN